MNRKKVSGVAVIMLLCVSIAGCVSDRQRPPKMISVGYVSTGITGLCVQVMQDQRIPEKQGLRIKYVGFTDPSALNNAFVLGKVDVNLAAGANVIALARSQGRKVQYFFPTLLNSVSVVVPQGSRARSLVDLKGKRIGWYGLQSGGGTAFYLVAQKHGLNALKDFQMIDAKPPALWPLLERRQLDAVVIYEPFVSRMLATGKYRELVGPFWKEWEDKTGQKMEMTGLAASDEWLGQNAQMAKDLAAAWRDAARFVQKNPEPVLAQYEQFTQLKSKRELALGKKRIPAILVTSWGNLDESIAKSLQVLAKDKVMLQSVPPGTIRKIE